MFKGVISIFIFYSNNELKVLPYLYVFIFWLNSNFKLNEPVVTF